MLVTASLIWFAVALERPNLATLSPIGIGVFERYSGLTRNEESEDRGDGSSSQKFPEIISGTIIFHQGEKFLCGKSKPFDGAPGRRRYVIALEGKDWQIWEPARDSDGWDGFNATYMEVCQGGTEE
jgi:hypothetical protein